MLEKEIKDNPFKIKEGSSKWGLHELNLLDIDPQDIRSLPERYYRCTQNVGWDYKGVMKLINSMEWQQDAIKLYKTDTAGFRKALRKIKEILENEYKRVVNNNFIHNLLALELEKSDED